MKALENYKGIAIMLKASLCVVRKKGTFFLLELMDKQ